MMFQFFSLFLRLRNSKFNTQLQNVKFVPTATAIKFHLWFIKLSKWSSCKWHYNYTWEAPADGYTRYHSSPRGRNYRIALGPVGPSVLYENISASGWRPRGDIKYCTRTRVQYLVPPSRLRWYLYKSYESRIENRIKNQISFNTV